MQIIQGLVFSHKLFLEFWKDQHRLEEIQILYHKYIININIVVVFFFSQNNAYEICLFRLPLLPQLLLPLLCSLLRRN